MLFDFQAYLMEMRDKAEKKETVEKYECEGCKYGRVNKHNGKYVKVMDWEMNKSVKFVDIVLDKKTSL
jgi:hypothetical protein